MARPLEDYDFAKYGPILGVSDEGPAAETIATAAYACAKAQAHDNPDPSVVGLIIDGERMGSAGEVPIGPPEYADFMSAADNRLFATTNVGVRVNTRFLQPLPEFRCVDADDEQAWVDSIFAKFKPFLATPDGEPRELTVRLVTQSHECHDRLRRLVPMIEAGRADGHLGPADIHRLSVMIIFDKVIDDRGDLDELRDLVALAGELGVPEVAVDGVLVEAARRRMSIQGLLNILSPAMTREMLDLGREHGVRVTYHYEIDGFTAARTVWTGLNSGRERGLTAAKYGLLPLKLEVMRYVVRDVQSWLDDWTPIPAFYVDTNLVTEEDVYEEDRVVEACKLFLSMAAEEGAHVILVDAPDRIDPRKLLKRGGENDPGVLSLDDVAELVAHAEGLGLKVLWSGGNSAEQAFELGKLGVFGIFTTGSTARVVPVHGTLAQDKMLAQQAEPTEIGVRRVHALLQGGFLCNVLGEGDVVDEINAKARTLIDCGGAADVCRDALDALDAVLVSAWHNHWNN